MRRARFLAALLLAGVTLHAQTPATATAAARIAEGEKLRLTGTAANLKLALPLFEQARDLARQAGDPKAEAAALTGLGRTLDGLGDRRRAIDVLREAIALHARNGDRSAEGFALNFLSNTHDLLGERDEAARLLDRALPLARASGDRRLEAVTLNNFGLNRANTGDRAKALEFYEQALAIHREIGNTRGEATTLTNIGTLHDQLGNTAQALKYLADSLPIKKTLGDPREIATTLNNLGAVYMRTDDLQPAVTQYDAALPYWRAAGDRSGEAATLHNLAAVRNAQGDTQLAIDLYQQALVLHRQAQFRVGEGNTLNNLASVYSALGRRAEAIETFGAALSLHRAVNNRASEASTLNNLGGEYLARGDLDAARRHFDDALTIWRAAGDRLGEARTLTGIGRLASRQQDVAGAAAAHQRALELARAVNSRRTEAVALHNLATVDVAAGRPDAALPRFDQALAVQRAIGDRAAEAATLYARARLHADAGRLAPAYDDIVAALALAESRRTSLTNPELRLSYFATVQDHFDFAISLITRRHAADPAGGWAERGLEMAERARARGFIDLLADARLNIREGVDAALLSRERELADSISAKAERQARLLGGPHTAAQADAVAADLRALVAAHEEVRTRIRSTSPRYAALTDAATASATAIRTDLLDDRTVLLEFAMSTSHVVAFLVSRSGVQLAELGARAEIDAAAAEFYRQTQAPGGTGVGAAAEVLGRLLLAPIGRALAAGPRLAIVAPGVLEYIPFAALPNPATGRVLLADHEMVRLPSASALLALRAYHRAAVSTAPTLLVFADPVFGADDPRVEGGPPATRAAASTIERSLQSAANDLAIGRLDRLLGTRREAAAIAALFPKGRATQALGFDASRTAATAPDLERHDIVHFATHAFLNTVRPELSGIVLSLVDRAGQPQRGFLGLSEIVNLRLAAGLVVLSACQTALGKEVRGEGLVGLSRAFMYAGTPRVVASVWRVDDTATAELMRRFYQGMTGPSPLRPAAALRAAQLAIMADRRWQSPYYWAGFLLQGDWR